jgi:transcriptional regulator with XRE-family HTH domain
MALLYSEIKFSENLREFMQKNGISGKDLAIRIGVSTSTVSLWLSGKRDPKPEHIDELCKSFNIDYFEFMHTSTQLSQSRLGFFFKKYNLNIEQYTRLDELEEELCVKFLEIVWKYRIDR